MSRWRDGDWPSTQTGSNTLENQVDRENKVLEAWAVGGSNDDHLLGQARSHEAA